MLTVGHTTLSVLLQVVRYAVLLLSVSATDDELQSILCVSNSSALHHLDQQCTQQQQHGLTQAAVVVGDA